MIVKFHRDDTTRVVDSHDTGVRIPKPEDETMGVVLASAPDSGVTGNLASAFLAKAMGIIEVRFELKQMYDICLLFCVIVEWVCWFFLCFKFEDELNIFEAGKFDP